MVRSIVRPSLRVSMLSLALVWALPSMTLVAGCKATAALPDGAAPADLESTDLARRWADLAEPDLGTGGGDLATSPTDAANDLNAGVDLAVVADLAATSDQGAPTDMTAPRADFASYDLACPHLSGFENVYGFANGANIGLADNTLKTVPANAAVSVTVQSSPSGAVNAVHMVYADNDQYTNQADVTMSFDPNTPSGASYEQWFAIIPAHASGTKTWFYLRVDGCDGTSRYLPAGGWGHNFQYQTQ